MNDIDSFFRRLRDTPVPGEKTRVSAVRSALLSGEALRSAQSGRLRVDMNDPLPTFFQSHRSAGELSSDTQQALLRGIITEGRRRQAAKDLQASPSQSFFSLVGFRLVAGALVLIIGMGSTLTVAAESSLPGDALYVVKTDIIEPVIDSLQWTNESQAAWAERRLERRLQESVALRSDGEPSDDDVILSAQHIEEEIDRATHTATAIGNEGDAETSLDLHANIEAALDAHEIAERYIPEKQQTVSDVVRRKKPQVTENRKKAERRFVESSGRLPGKVVERKEELQEEIDDIREELEQDSDGVLNEDIASLTSAAERTLDDIESSPDANETEDALLRLESALRLTEEADNLLETQDTIESHDESSEDDEIPTDGNID